MQCFHFRLFFVLLKLGVQIVVSVFVCQVGVCSCKHLYWIILDWKKLSILQSLQFSRKQSRPILSPHPSYNRPSLSALVNTKFDCPIPTAWNVASVFEIFEQKRFASCGQLWQSVPKTEPLLAPTALLYAEQDLSPLGIIIMRLGRGTQISKLSKLHWLDWLRSKMKRKF